jgi:hypothetical protein
MKVIIPTILLIVAVPSLVAEECIRGRLTRTTDEFFYTASSAQGHADEIIAVDVSLTVGVLHQRPVGITVVGCYDKSMAELVDEPVLAEPFERLAFINRFFRLDGAPRVSGPDGVGGFLLALDLWPELASEVFATGTPIPVATFYFRLKGNAGDTFSLDFCDGAFSTGSCVTNFIYYVPLDGAESIDVSTRHVPGLIRITEGEPINTEIPPRPPLARVYSEIPTVEDAEISFELSGAVASPGDRSVPLDLTITSNYEFSGFSVSLVFPWPALQDYLEIERIEEHTRPGLVQISNQVGRHGHLGLLLLNSRLRVGAEGERVKVATIHVNVKEAAAEAREIAPRFEGTLGFENMVTVNAATGLEVLDLPVATKVGPIRMTAGVLAIRRATALGGDVNQDGVVNITDAIAILGDLFLGADPIVCAGAADFNADQEVNIADAVAILRYLFGGDLAFSPQEVVCD